ncbi:ABC transporter ATP-binding protein [Mesorhizobium sp.]|uniref:ABC transporter ATP-binding protein n=1 Tax=Mesorhizobium sp. TaxID=1871066 RepID=UPI000FE607FD|nr:ABC transporter ATP-binding protein [Mesorhizobium sp.]RWE00116.1 MAG: ABC transporter ATP-binding protein [Mesorhizobium sp.]
MTDTVIQATNISKAYRLGVANDSFPTLRDALASGARRGLRWRPDLARRNGGDERFWALRDVSFEVRAGEVLAVIGPNGAGKSTILKILARIVEPTSGRVTIRGRLGALLEVGTGFHAELTGRENIYLNGAILGMRRAEIAAKLHEIVDFSGVEQFLDTPVKRYSSGMYLRLAFAVAAHVEPDILVVDEVLAVGDAAFQKKCIGKVGQIARTGRTVVFVSHQLSVVQKLCNRAILIGDGTIKADGPTAKVIETYLGMITNQAVEDLAIRAVRSGRGQVRLTAIEIEGDAGALTSGQRAWFRFRAAGDQSLVDCSFTIYDEFGVAVTSFDSAVHSDGELVGDSFVCEFQSFLLRPGRYRINAALTSREGVLEDHVEGAATFDVQSGVLGGRLVNAEPGYGSMTMPHHWTRGA